MNCDSHKAGIVGFLSFFFFPEDVISLKLFCISANREAQLVIFKQSILLQQVLRNRIWPWIFCRYLPNSKCDLSFKRCDAVVSVRHLAVKLAAVYLSSAALSVLPSTGKKMLSGKRCLTSSLPKIHHRPKANSAQKPIFEDEAGETTGAVPHVLSSGLLVNPLTQPCAFICWLRKSLSCCEQFQTSFLTFDLSGNTCVKSGFMVLLMSCPMQTLCRCFCKLQILNPDFCLSG